MSIRILLNGAAGKMGRAMAAFILADPGFELAAAVDINDTGRDLGELAQGKNCGVLIESDLAKAIDKAKPDVMLDFTDPDTVAEGVRTALSRGLSCVVGTTGLTDAELAEADALARKTGAGLIVAPNFALSAVLMTRFAQEAARYFPDYELVETHHDKKKDAPSGTALSMVRAIGQVRAPHRQGRCDEYEEVAGCRGGDCEGARVHSVRLPGVVARHEITFGGPGQLLAIRQECTSRECFWPGVRLALLRVGEVKGLVYGLDDII